jgi:hypothetical protein
MMGCIPQTEESSLQLTTSVPVNQAAHEPAPVPKPEARRDRPGPPRHKSRRAAVEGRPVLRRPFAPAQQPYLPSRNPLVVKQQVGAGLPPCACLKLSA